MMLLQQLNVVLPRKTSKLFLLLLSTTCSSIQPIGTSSCLLISLFPNTKSITSVKQVPLCPPYPILSTFKFKSRSLVTQASNEDVEVANQVLDEIISDLKKSPRLMKELCTNHIHELCKKRKLKAAVRLLQLLRDKHAINSLPAYNHLLAAACEENDTQIASLIFKDMFTNYVLMNSATYFNVAKAVSKSNDLTFVQSFVKEISELISSGSVTVINRIIYAFADCGHVHNAILVFDHMKSFKFKPDLVTYNTMLGILGKAGHVDEMLDVFAFMKKAGNIEESLRLFEDMKHGNIRPSIYIYRSLINNLKTIGLSELAQKFLEEMNECREDLVGPKDFKRKNR